MSGRAATSSVISGRAAISVNDPGTELPTGWCRASLLDVADLGTGHTPSRRIPEYWDGDIRWVGIKDARRAHGGTIYETEQTVTELGLENSAARLLPEKTVCLSRTASVGYVFTLGKEMATSQDFVTWSCTEALLPEYLQGALIAEGEDIRRFGKGSTHTTIYFPEVKAFHIALPPLPEQRRIVAKLDQLSARSAAARDHLARTTKLATRAKQAILARAFQGGLVNSSSITGASVPSRDELIRLRDERRLVEGLRKKGKNRSVPISSAVLPDVPDTWQWLTFDDCAWDMTVGHVGPMKDRYVEDGIPFLRSLNVKPNAISTRDIRYIDADFDEELRKSRLLPGDLVVVRTGEPGVAAVIDEDIGPCNCSDLVISRLCEFIDPHFAAYYMNSSFARNTSSAMQVGVAQRHFNVGAMSVMPVPVPPVSEQREIVRRIEAAFERIDRMTEEASRATHLLDRLDERLLAKAFRGELVPQDPDDEPAEALLTRIREARAATPKAKRGRKAKG